MGQDRDSRNRPVHTWKCDDNKTSIIVKPMGERCTIQNGAETIGYPYGRVTVNTKLMSYKRKSIWGEFMT